MNLKNLEMNNNLYTLNNIKQKDAAINTLTALDNDNRNLIRQERIISYMLIGMISLLGLSFAFIIKRIKLKRQLEKQVAIAGERERIITDLHDDVGSTLSSMRIYSDLVASFAEPKQVKSKELMSKISEQCRDLTGRMSDIIWSLKPADDGKYSLSGRLKNYARELLADKGISTEFNIDYALDSRIENPLARKNILLIAKEAMNNIAKYSGATVVTISLFQTNDFIVLKILDNGKGFDTQLLSAGNGLENMRQRSRQMNGEMHHYFIAWQGHPRCL